MFSSPVIFRVSLLSKLVTQLVVVDPKALDAPQPTNDLSAPNNLQTELMSVMNCLQILRQKQDEMFAFDRCVVYFSLNYRIIEISKGVTYILT